jgi:hypothetical protein
MDQLKKFSDFKNFKQYKQYQEGKMGYILAWLLGVPIPVLFVIFLLRGCT